MESECGQLGRISLSRICWFPKLAHKTHGEDKKNTSPEINERTNDHYHISQPFTHSENTLIEADDVCVCVVYYVVYACLEHISKPSNLTFGQCDAVQPTTNAFSTFGGPLFGHNISVTFHIFMTNISPAAWVNNIFVFLSPPSHPEYWIAVYLWVCLYAFNHITRFGSPNLWLNLSSWQRAKPRARFVDIPTTTTTTKQQQQQQHASPTAIDRPAPHQSGLRRRNLMPNTELTIIMRNDWCAFWWLMFICRKSFLNRISLAICGHFHFTTKYGRLRITLCARLAHHPSCAIPNPRTLLLSFIDLTASTECVAVVQFASQSPYVPNECGTSFRMRDSIALRPNFLSLQYPKNAFTAHTFHLPPKL